MSRLFEALQKSELFGIEASKIEAAPNLPSRLLHLDGAQGSELAQCSVLPLSVPAANFLVSATDEYSLGAEKFRLLAIRIRQLQEKRELKKVMITSATVQEGKTLVSANLAFTLALREKQRVLLVEGDLRQPRLSSMLATGKLEGLSEWTQRGGSIASVVYQLGESSVWFLPAGEAGSRPLEILHSNRLPEAIAQLCLWFDFIIIDTPPTVSLTDATVWERLADGTIVVVKEGKTSKKILEKTVETLNRGKLLGTVLNYATLHKHKYYQYQNAPRDSAATLDPQKREK